MIEPTSSWEELEARSGNERVLDSLVMVETMKLNMRKEEAMRDARCAGMGRPSMWPYVPGAIDSAVQDIVEGRRKA